MNTIGLLPKRSSPPRRRRRVGVRSLDRHRRHRAFKYEVKAVPPVRQFPRRGGQVTLQGVSPYLQTTLHSSSSSAAGAAPPRAPLNALVPEFVPRTRAASPTLQQLSVDEVPEFVPRSHSASPGLRPAARGEREEPPVWTGVAPVRGPGPGPARTTAAAYHTAPEINTYRPPTHLEKQVSEAERTVFNQVIHVADFPPRLPQVTMIEPRSESRTSSCETLYSSSTAGFDQTTDVDRDSDELLWDPGYTPTLADADETERGILFMARFLNEKILSETREPSKPGHVYSLGFEIWK